MTNVEEVSNYLKAIADPTRLKIIGILNSRTNPICVNALADKLNVTQSAVSQHLRILKQVGLVIGNRKGYHIHYLINHDNIKRYTNLLNSIILPSDNIVDNCNTECP